MTNRINEQKKNKSKFICDNILTNTEKTKTEEKLNTPANEKDKRSTE